MNNKKNLKLIFAIEVVVVLLLITTAFIFYDAQPIPKNPSAYTITVYDDGSAKVSVHNVNELTQTDKDVIFDHNVYKAGSLIVPGNGDPAYYENGKVETVVMKEVSDD